MLGNNNPLGKTVVRGGACSSSELTSIRKQMAMALGTSRDGNKLPKKTPLNTFADIQAITVMAPKLATLRERLSGG